MCKIEITETNNNLVKIHKDLILSRHSLSEQAQKIIRNLICMINKNDKDFHEYILDAKTFGNLIDSSSKNIINDMKKHARELKSSSVIIDKGKTILETNMIISFEYEKNGGYIKFMIHPELKPYLLNLRENYLSYGANNFFQLKGVYTIRLFEILKHNYNQGISYKENPKNPFVTYKMPIEELKTMFQIPSSYNINKIKTHILDKSKKELSEKTDIFFTYELAKNIGRAFDTIIFTIGKNKK